MKIKVCFIAHARCLKPGLSTDFQEKCIYKMAENREGDKQ
jgi:hypothetical protein